MTTATKRRAGRPAKPPGMGLIIRPAFTIDTELQAAIKAVQRPGEDQAAFWREAARMLIAQRQQIGS